MAVEPVVYGASERPPRGDYARANADYTCAQNWAAYTAQDHDTYRRLYERQSALLPGLASEAFIAALPSLASRTTYRASRKSTSACTAPRAGRSWPCRG